MSEPIAITDALIQVRPGSLQRTEMGSLADAETRRLVGMPLSVSKEELAAIDAIVGSPHTAYNTRSDFIRHAIWELVTAWVHSGFPSQYAYDIVSHLGAMRSAAHRQRIRQEFEDVVSVYEVSLSDGVEAGNWSLVTGALEDLQGYVDRTPDPYWAEHLRRVISRNPNVQRAINSLYEASRAEPSLKSVAEVWQHWLESLA